MKKLLLALLVASVVCALTWANWPITRLPSGSKADRVVVEKSKRTLTLLKSGSVLKVYEISLGHTPIGKKEKEGDKKTPEGIYHIAGHNASSSFHRALRISYPEQADIDRARNLGVKPGSDIMVHGIMNGLGFLGRTHLLVDWTAGCIALTNPEIDEIYDAVPDGTEVEIRK
jgi:murein L,D-transpeptidase YafK